MDPFNSYNMELLQDHVKGMEEVLTFVHSQCEKYLHVKVQDPLGELAKPRLLM